MAKKEVSPIDTFGEEFGATFLGKRIINQAATPSLAVTRCRLFVSLVVSGCSGL